MTGTTITVPLLLAEGVGSRDGALGTFGLYLVGVFVLAGFAHRLQRRGEFVSEYFLGSRGLGTWAFALTFAATTASGGTFIGFPSKVYSHGWVLALWIASYMVVPLIGMGLLGKRINHVARKLNAVTMPELLQERFRHGGVGLFATLLIVVFMFFYILANFIAGSRILATLLAETPVFHQGVALLAAATADVPVLASADPAHLLCLLVFAAAVIVYVVYGGFRAVVWTDVLQGIVMFAGVGIMLALALHQTGGLESATRKLAAVTPPELGTGVVRTVDDAPSPAAAIVPAGTWLPTADGRLAKTSEPITVAAGATQSDTAIPVVVLGQTPAAHRPQPDPLSATLVIATESTVPARFGAGEPGVYLRPPGPSRESDLGFLTVSLAFSFFVFWAFGTAGQPANMVRLMAFRNTRTLRRAIVTVSIYFSVVYFSIVVIFCCGRVLLPGLDDDPDRIMPELAAHLTAAAGSPWLAGILLAAPFAAVMSSVDSFLLMVSSSLVRDVYQRRLHPDADERRLRRLAHLITTLVGLAAMVAVINPPRQLQDLIVFASGGMAGAFLVPMALALYWPRFTAGGAIAGMLAGFGMHAALTIVGFAQSASFRAADLFGIQPFVWDLAASAFFCVAVSLVTRPPDAALVARLFGTPAPPDPAPDA